MSDSQRWQDELNPAQREAVLAGEGAVLVVAGAGSGKTRTLAYRVAELINRGVKPERICLLTFTRRASEQMLRRAGSAAAEKASLAGRVWGGTFHAIANRLLRLYAKPAGLSEQFTIMDQSDAADLMNVIRHELNLSAKTARFPRKRTCLSIYSRRMNGRASLEEVLTKCYPWCVRWQKELAELFRTYVETKQRQSVLDYDDLLHYWAILLENDAIAEEMGGRFDHILVDEYQDTNLVQAAILRGMRKHNANIMVVGDDAQSIYSFRSATVRNMLDFPKQFPHARIITLDRNYRSTGRILTTTNRLISQATQRYAKELWSDRPTGQPPQLITCKDESDQDDAIIERILAHYEQGVPLKQQAVLFRASSHSASLELALQERSIPFVKYGGLKFLEAAHVKDLLAVLRIVENPSDEMAWFRLLQLLDGVGPVTAAKAFSHVQREGADASAIATFNPPPAAKQAMESLAELLAELKKLASQPPAMLIERVARFLKPIVRRIYENPEPRCADLEHLGELASTHRSTRQFLSELILDPPSSTGDLAGVPMIDEDYLILSTIHSAKGCEWDAVYLIHAADGNLPSDMATGSAEEIEEELRLTYVAMTRAKDFLYVAWPMRYYHTKHRRGDAHSYAQLCRFLTDDVRETMDVLSRNDDDANDAPSQIETSTDIAARLREMW
jgi:DNA helicase II / ATP-dependent DNA helicase PcrA